VQCRHPLSRRHSLQPHRFRAIVHKRRCVGGGLEHRAAGSSHTLRRNASGDDLDSASPLMSRVPRFRHHNDADNSLSAYTVESAMTNASPGNGLSNNGNSDSSSGGAPSSSSCQTLHDASSRRPIRRAARRNTRPRHRCEISPIHSMGITGAWWRRCVMRRWLAVRAGARLSPARRG